MPVMQHNRDAREEPGLAAVGPEEARRLARAAMHARPGLNGPSPSGRARAWPRWLLAAIGGAAVLGLGLILAVSLRAGGVGQTSGLAEAGLPLADEAGVLAALGDHFTAFRLAQARSVLVLTFPSLHAQALALNRTGAFIEKAGMPHDHVMTMAEFESRRQALHQDFDTFYYGHDYSAADMARFYATARQDGVKLLPEETALQALLQAQGLLRPGVTGAIISVPALSSDPPVDADARAAILRHEVSHGVYFTDPAYAGYTAHFWADIMREPERAAFRRVLGAEGYDTGNEDLMRNEMQAYLVHTPDPRFFDAAALGLDTRALRKRFLDGMPESWLRRETPR